MNTQSEKPKFFSTKTVLKKNIENPNAPLRMNRSVQSTNHTNDNRTTITINETLTKTFFVNFQSETCCKPTLLTRYYSGKVSRNRIFHRLRTSMLDTLEIALLQPHGI